MSVRSSQMEGGIRVELTKVKGESRVMVWSGRSTNDPKPLI